MSQHLTIFNNASAAFDLWHLMSPEEQALPLSALQKKVPAQLQGAFNYQSQHATTLTKERHNLVSPTGETNELYTQGRGVAILLVEDESERGQQAAIAMLAALLVAGNSVVLCSDNTQLRDFVQQVNDAAILPTGLLQLATASIYAQLLQQDIRNFAFVGASPRAITLNKELAAKPNAITGLVAETDLLNLTTAQDPALVLRFVTEKVSTINITAIGGNAMLLELGNAEH